MTRQKIAGTVSPDYQALFRRVSALAQTRQRELRQNQSSIGARVVARGWNTVPLRNGAMAFACLALDFVVGTDGIETISWRDEETLDFDHPYARELSVFQDYESRLFDELYVDFDFRTSPTESRWVMSYGEYVDVPPDDLDPFVERAAQRAAFYADAVAADSEPMPRRVLARECNLLENIGKKIGPNNLVDVLLSFGT